MQARYYDPVVGRFLSNDFVGFMGHLNGEQGVQGFNRFAYVNSNPYKYTDPDGRKVELGGSSEFKKKVRRKVEMMRSAHPSLDKMYTDLEGSSHTHYIAPRSNKPGANKNENSNQALGHAPYGSVKGKGTGSITWFDPDDTQGPRDTRDPAVALTHEIKHASDRDQGIFDPTPDPSNNNVPTSEKRAIEAENIMRRALPDHEERPTNAYP
ncbi:RHS repeat-associated core domain-containing protein [Saccharophagus degradans]|uniref:RHS repeat-associated core domain-containing protein n=1 Tax=Saccharophagus degradans TaxID=86304 RepID=A0AAW7XAQ1_9GAMM|nr:RHS repeat-associated core domain-containing protein [Saccharophagus degradans]MDO6424743.1 RHS repeat-associated core domain-containing protein [Saccharophagus degradans]MDO6609505.1 RHS repeat-associated core domain-containing protein [Saccharophagus degradans]